jgi:hypothetical protein
MEFMIFNPKIMGNVIYIIIVYPGEDDLVFHIAIMRLRVD